MCVFVCSVYINIYRYSIAVFVAKISAVAVDRIDKYAVTE